MGCLLIGSGTRWDAFLSGAEPDGMPLGQAINTFSFYFVGRCYINPVSITDVG